MKFEQAIVDLINDEADKCSEASKKAEENGDPRESLIQASKALGLTELLVKYVDKFFPTVKEKVS